MRNRLLGLFGLTMTAVWAVPATAQTAPETTGAQEAAGPSEAEPTGGPFTVTGGATVVSDYRFRGISLSDEDFAVQGTLEVSHESGLYGGIWASSIDDTPLYGEVELDLYAGWRGEVSPGTTLNGGLLYYYYPDGKNSAGNSDYFEPFLTLTHQIGPVAASVGANYAWDQSAIGSDDNLYLWGGLSTSIPNTPLTLVAKAGHSDGSLAPTGDYWDWSLGVTATAQGFTLGASYVDTDLGNAHNVDAGLVFSLGFAF